MKTQPIPTKPRTGVMSKRSMATYQDMNKLKKKITKSIRHGTTSHYKDQYCAYCTLKKEQGLKDRKLKVVLYELLGQTYIYGHFMSKSNYKDIINLIKSI